MLSFSKRIKISDSNKNTTGSKKVTDEDLVLVKRPKVHGFKATVVVSKKVANRAVDRNRIKRLITESLRGQNFSSKELMIIVKKNLSNLKKDQVQLKLSKLLKRL